MTNQNLNIDQVYGLFPKGIEGIDKLAELAIDMRWSWNHSADKIWQQLEPSLWELTHNPWIVLQTVSYDHLEQQMADPVFRAMIDELMSSKETKAGSPAWFQENHPDSHLTSIAYFSMEFMLSEALPIYVGGLGNVSGDQLKSASDLGVPVTAVGLLYQQGYFRQEIDKYGSQQALFPYNDPGSLPIMPLRLPNGEWLRLKIDLPGYPVWLRTWQVKVGRVKLFLLDSNDPANLPIHRGITSELYGGGAELRIKQEILLGIGGWKMLRALGIKPEVCHMNEGHAAFLVLERANDFMKDNGVSFETALAVTRAGNIFTTHTAVAAGFDHFSLSLMGQYFNDYARNELKIDLNTLMALGKGDENSHTESFNMAYLAIRGCGAVNAVSNLHEKVSRQLFVSLFSRWPLPEIPVGYVTNGVHMPSWDSEFADELWTQACGKDRWKGELETIEDDIYKIPAETLWQFRNQSRDNLVNYIRQRFERQLTVSGQSPAMIEAAVHVFSAHTLTLGFARRFVPYKRPNLLLHDAERFVRILMNAQHPVQLIIAGKAPPFDEEGNLLIRQWNQFIEQYNLYNHVIFLSDYDMLLTEHLVQGVDVWLNTPRRPWEACGTSGMKVLVNGGINLSELDGWWAEAFTPDVGWALGDGKEHGDDPAWDATEANALYDLLEQQIIPEFYSRNENNIPLKWIGRMQNSMAKLTPQFSANRTVREYTEIYYLPAAAAYLQRSSNKGAGGNKIVNAKHVLRNKWNEIKFGEVKTTKTEKGYLFQAQVFFDKDLQDKIAVEVFADSIDEGKPERIQMTLASATEAKKEFLYHVEIESSRSANDYTTRIVPCYENITIPLEDNLILWQH
jgi:glycogen phosphorylase